MTENAVNFYYGKLHGHFFLYKAFNSQIGIKFDKKSFYEDTVPVIHLSIAKRYLQHFNYQSKNKKRQF